MASLERSVLIQAPVEMVFQCMDDPSNQPKITSDSARIEDVEKLPGGGTQSSYVYKLGPGMEVKGQLTTSEYTPNERIVYDFSGGLQGNIWWLFEAVDDSSSRVTYKADYDLDMPLLGEAISSLAAKFSETEVETQLANLKQLVEGKTA
ncbi:SRPBCC family protein [filamentous cyanobacterium CCP5]|nr:SRPBCC family protein [filamentous cyanobacterium CCP5]